MSKRAWSYLGGVLLAAAICCALAFRDISWSPALLLPFGLLAALAILAQLYKAEAPNHMAFFATPVFLFAGLLVLPPAWFILLVVVPHAVEWLYIRLRHRRGVHLRAWYIQPFNIAMHILAGTAAGWVSAMPRGDIPWLGVLFMVTTTLAAAACYLIVNQLLLGQALVLAREITWRESGVLKLENLLPEFIMVSLGAVIARLWALDPGFILPALLPLVLMYRALRIPQLEQEAQTDGKTGLANARHFKNRFTEELDRAQRFNRPLAVIMADLDLLRNVNNTYGHLAGDAVLEGIGKLIRQTIREYDIAGRFGGEEFAIVLPEAGEAEARALAERIRQVIEAASFPVATSPTPIRVTMSLGVACYPDHATTQEGLIHEADVAVYQAKFHGRNRVVCASDVPQAVKLEHLPADQPPPTPYAAAFRGQHGVDTAGAAEQPAEPAAPHATPTQTTSGAPTVPSRPESVAGGAPTAGPRDRAAQLGFRHTDAVSLAEQPPHFALGGFVAATVAAAVVVALLGGILGEPSQHLYLLALLVGLAFLTELLQISVYGEHSISVSLALTIAATLLAGMPGAAAASAAIVAADQLRRRRPLGDLYKVAFNWATHVLAVAPLVFTAGLVTSLPASRLPQLTAVCLLATVGYYGIETSLISVAISLAKRLNPLTIWRTQFRWLAGHYLVLGIMGLCVSLGYQALGLLGIGAFALPLLMLRYAQAQYIQRTQASVHELKRMNRELSHANDEVLTASQAIQYLNQELFLTLGTILDARDPYVSGHAAQVATYAAAIATDLGLPPERIEVIRQAGFLHDLGKIAIAEQILYKPGTLTAAEYETIKTHAAIGATLLETSQGLRHLAPFVRHHHERWDGQGYPDGLAGEQIPLEARILNVCDSVEAMAADRPYHAGMALPEILAEVRRCAGMQFDPLVAETFIRIAERAGTTLVINSAREVLRKQQHAAAVVPVPPAGSPSWGAEHGRSVVEPAGV